MSGSEGYYACSHLLLSDPTSLLSDPTSLLLIKIESEIKNQVAR